jgi:hypothetical protein
VLWVAFGVLIAGLSLAGRGYVRGGPAIGLLLAATCVYLGFSPIGASPDGARAWTRPGCRSLPARSACTSIGPVRRRRPERSRSQQHTR